MAEEKKPGLLKRMFSFGFGKKADTAAQEAEAEAAEVAKAEEAARAEAERAQAEQAEAERLAQEEKAAAAKAEVERLAAEQAVIVARQEAEAAKQAAQQEAEAAKAASEKAKKLEQEKAEADKLAREKRLEAEKEAAKKKADSEKLAKLKAQEEADKKAAELEQKKQVEEAAALEERLQEEEAAKAGAESPIVDAQEPEQTETPEEPSTPVPADEDEARKEGWFKRLRKGLSRSSSALTENITSVFTKKKLDEDTLQELEDILIQADLGVETAMNVTDALASQRMGKDVSDEEVRQIMADEIAKVLEPVAEPLELDLDHKPHVILVVGVNGSGKTTTIGKISQKLHDSGYSTMLVAGDTFRAAAVEQLHIWGERTKADVVSRDNGADAAGLAFDAFAEARAKGHDVMLMDTAGRLQNRKELMDELEKIIRVLKKQDPSAPHTVLLTLDATTGQNALNQVEIFKDVAGVNGLVMTKLDGTARGGILVSISSRHKLPIYFIGVGEQVEDLEPFEATEFAKSIAGL